MKKVFLSVVMLCAVAFAPATITISPAEAPPVKKDPAPPVVPVVKLPETKTAKPNRYFCLKAAGNCTSVKWIVPTGLDPIDADIALKDPMTIVLIGEAGVYVVQCYGALGDVASDIASCTVTIGTPPPPTPPTPPIPPNPLTAALQAGYALDTDADKASSLAFLQNVYAGLAPLASAWTDVKTNADAQKKISAVVASPGIGLTATQVVNLRKAIGADFVAKFGSVATTPIDLSALSTELAAIATALKGVK